MFVDGERVSLQLYFSVQWTASLPRNNSKWMCLLSAQWPLSQLLHKCQLEVHQLALLNIEFWTMKEIRGKKWRHQKVINFPVMHGVHHYK
jgi:hypothetical protein